MSGSLAAFQDAFVAALTGAPDSAAGEVAALVGQPGFAVYRNTLAKGCVEALCANFPAVERLVGEEWFAAAATLYAREMPPRSGPLLEYGENFPAFCRASNRRVSCPICLVSHSWTGSGLRYSAPLSNPFWPSLPWRNKPRSSWPGRRLFRALRCAGGGSLSYRCTASGAAPASSARCRRCWSGRVKGRC